MKNHFSKNSLQSESKLDWNLVHTLMREKFGVDIFDSWLRKIKLVDEYNDYILLSVPTRFIRDWITSRYVDQIIAIIKQQKKEIIRIEFIVDDKINLSDENNNNNQTNENITYIKESYLQYNRIDPNKNFNNFLLGSSNKLAFEAAKKNFRADSPL